MKTGKLLLLNFLSKKKTFIKFKYDMRKGTSTGRLFTGREVKGQALDMNYINSRTLKRASCEPLIYKNMGFF